MTEKYNTLCETCIKDCKQLEIAIIIECPNYTHNGKRYVDKLGKRKNSRRELTNKEKADIKKLVCQCAN